MNFHHALNTPVLDDAYAKVTAGAHTGAYGANDLKTPSDAQAQAGTYKMGRVTVQGLRIAIEQPCGSIRSGKGADGKEWSSRMAAHYGYFENTRGADGDGIDCFVGPYPESEQVFVINQRNPGGGFDEHKVMVGFSSERHARGAYLDSYERGWRGLQSLVPISLDQLRWWIKHGKKSIALSAESLPQQGTNPMNPKITWTEAQPDSISLDQVLYQLRRMDGADGLLLDSVTMAEIMEDTDGVIALDALVVENAQLTRMAERLRAIMDRSGGAVKAPAVQVSEPFRARGVTNIAAVFELSDGQTVSVFFHNPDTAPNKLAPGDEMISWKWLLNKKDITIVVAPEKGQDLNPRLVASRIMKLAEKNSPAFQKANAKRSERMGNIEAIRGRIAEKEATLNELVAQIEGARLEKDQRVIAAEDEARMKGAQPQKGDSFTIVAWYGDDRSGERDLALNESTKEKALETARKRIAFDLETKTFGLPSLVRWYYRPSHKYGDEVPVADLMPTATNAQSLVVPTQESEEEGPAVVELRDWQKNPEADPAGGAEVIEAWNSKQADALLLGLQAGQANAAPEAVARQYIAKHLQGRLVKTKAGDCIINSISRSKLPTAGMNRKGSVRLRVIPRVPEVLIHGTPDHDDKSLDKERTDAFTGFLPFTHTLDMGDLRISVRLKVGLRDGAPPLAYSFTAKQALDAVSQKENPTYRPSLTEQTLRTDMGFSRVSPPTEVGLGDENSPLGAILSESLDSVNDDNLNIEILAVWDKNGKPVDIDESNGSEGAQEPQNPSAAVDAAYQFANATDAFKERVAGSIDETDYSEFASAKAMDMKAKELGSEIHWGMGAALDAVQAEEGDEDDFDPEAEFDACPVWQEEDEEVAA